MIRVLLIFIVCSLCITSTIITAKPNDFEEIARIEEIDFTLSAKRINGTYKDFKFDFKDWWTKYPKWEGST
jgi:hypothetical protein